MKLECILPSMYDLLNFVAKVPANQRKQFFLDCYVKIRKKERLCIFIFQNFYPKIA